MKERKKKNMLHAKALSIKWNNTWLNGWMVGLLVGWLTAAAVDNNDDDNAGVSLKSA